MTPVKAAGPSEHHPQKLEYTTVREIYHYSMHAYLYTNRALSFESMCSVWRIHPIEMIPLSSKSSRDLFGPKPGPPDLIISDYCRNITAFATLYRRLRRTVASSPLLSVRCMTLRGHSTSFNSPMRIYTHGNAVRSQIRSLCHLL